MLLGPWERASGAELLDQLLEVDATVYLPGDLLAKIDIATMAYSLEARSPLLDHEFMELAASIPPELKASGVQRKIALKGALREWLPETILDGPKQGFELPVAPLAADRPRVVYPRHPARSGERIDRGWMRAGRGGGADRRARRRHRRPRPQALVAAHARALGPVVHGHHAPASDRRKHRPPSWGLMTRRPDLSIIVVTHNGREMALTTLRSALAAVGEASVEWLVVDAGSTDGTPEAIEREFSQVRIFRRDNQGFAASNNVALNEAQGRYVLLLNPDVEIRSGSFGDLLEAMDARPELGMASVIQRGTDGELQPSIRRFPSPLRSLGEALFAAHWPVLRTFQELETSPRRYQREGPADWLVGAFLIARREALRAVGPMDERFFLYSEEIDWCYRFWQAGWPIAHLPVMVVTHHSGDAKRGDLMAQLSHSRLLFAAKHYGVARSGGIRAGLALEHAIRIVVFAAAALLRPAQLERVRAERAALRVTLGLSAPPLGPYSRPAAVGPAA